MNESRQKAFIEDYQQAVKSGDRAGATKIRDRLADWNFHGLANVMYSGDKKLLSDIKKRGTDWEDDKRLAKRYLRAEKKVRDDARKNNDFGAFNVSHQARRAFLGKGYGRVSDDEIYARAAKGNSNG